MSKIKTPLWQLLGKLAGPTSTICNKVPESKMELLFSFFDGEMVINFDYHVETVEGQKSSDKNLIPEDPDDLICDYLNITKIVFHPLSGSETTIDVTKEIETEFIKYIKETDFITCDTFSLQHSTI